MNIQIVSTALNLINAYHWAYWRFEAAALEIIISRRVRELVHVHKRFCLPFIKFNDIQATYQRHIVKKFKHQIRISVFRVELDSFVMSWCRFTCLCFGRRQDSFQERFPCIAVVKISSRVWAPGTPGVTKAQRHEPRRGL